MSHNIMRRKEKRKRNMERKIWERGSVCHRKTEAEAEGRLKDHKMTDD